MKKNTPSFHRSIVIVALIHLGFLALIVCLVKPPKKAEGQVVWMNPGSFAAPTGEENSLTQQEESSSKEEEPAISESEEPKTPEPNLKPVTEVAAEPLPETLPEPKPEPPTEAQSAPTPETVITPPAPLDSEIPVTTPKPTPTATPEPTLKPKPKTAPKATPKPKTSPKLKPKPKPKPALKEKEEEEEKPKPVAKPKSKNVSTHKSTSPKSSSSKKSSKSSSSKPSRKKNGVDHENENLKKAFLNSKGQGTGNGAEGSGNGSGSHGNGVNENVLAGYHELIHDRFYSQWEQPTAIPTEHRHDFVCTLRLTIERDGAISNFSLAKPSGNPVMDESVLAAAAKVKQIAPLPEGLKESAPYNVNINFELE